MSNKYKRKDVILATFGFNTVLNEPFKRLYEFGYYTDYGCVVYKQGESNMQDSAAFKLSQIRPATQADLNNELWG